ncbi:hypothetical protein IW140_002904 [Coemansia sp. RSA 1813]|nr:hypothetical protein EV178_002824 [Coemansia sp. RSA 1646]KAJ1771991.1 hypothetical protein LPJ74_001883 [Coemansia sp. RSA 1843]KAJ2089763.1 hypothetical protein IW138_003219 [Coemansia sp. RSA 986]KAJ2214233.1 hypothetical protein EV179_003135 [Coemansia sp. RSA 487]KAJ2569650.1 hypothetical protein IW140_002904 [Coemansia sp. RSA 1813]
MGKSESSQINELLSIGRQISAVLASDTVSALYMQNFADQARLAAIPHAREEKGGWPADVHRVYSALRGLKLQSVTRIYHVEHDYYMWPLYERALSVGAPSPDHMCKTVVMTNTRWRPSDATPQHLCIVVQYTQTISTQVVVDVVRALDKGHTPRKRFNFRLADEDTAYALTGFGHNGVAPIGLANEEVPIMLSAAISALRPPVLWLGAGDIDFKMAMPVDAFVAATGCLVAHISAPTKT